MAVRDFGNARSRAACLNPKCLSASSPAVSRSSVMAHPLPSVFHHKVYHRTRTIQSDNFPVISQPLPQTRNIASIPTHFDLNQAPDIDFWWENHAVQIT